MSTLQQNLEGKFYQLAGNFLKELGAEKALLHLSPESSLEKDLGIDSLGRVELIHRVNSAFKIQLPEKVLTHTQTIKDLIQAIKAANPAIHYKPNQFADPLQSIEFDPLKENNLVDMFCLYAQVVPDRPHIYLRDETGAEQLITYGSLFKEAKSVASGLVERGLKRGETVALMLPTCPDYFAAFVGILLAGGIPVSIYPPYRPHLIEEYVKREAIVLNNAEVRGLITFHQVETLSKLFKSFIPSLKHVATADELKRATGDLPPLTIKPDDTVLVQYTSGSTGNPKGVQLHHVNLLSNIIAGSKQLTIEHTDVGVSWLPLYHDMGLMSWLGSLVYGNPITIMTPWAFLSRPENWLWAIHYHRASFTAGPNFAYELCIKKITPELITGLDLRCLRIALNGAEAVQPKTLSRFTQKFKPYGLKDNVLCPAYGLAESTVALTLPNGPRVPVIDKISAEAFERQRRAIPATSLDKSYLTFVGVGCTVEGQRIRIVDECNQQLPERHIGLIQFQGTSSMQGYYRNKEATAKAFHEGWWDTGDYGYLVGNELFITGRKKDLIIKGGRNITPEEIETIASQVEGIRKGCVVAFGVSHQHSGTEHLIIVAEIKSPKTEDHHEIVDKIKRYIVTAKDIAADKVLLVPPHTIPKTSSGKLQRSATKEMYLKGKLYKRALPINIQIIKLFSAGLFARLKRWCKGLGKVIYTGYLYVVITLLSLPFLAVMFMVSGKVLAKLVKLWAKLTLKLAFCPIHLHQLGKHKEDECYMITPNHCSYIDAIVLLAVLPTNVAFVGKQELLKAPIIRTVFKKLNYLTVNRLNFEASLKDTSIIEQALKDHRSIVLFPEGTFTYATGLRSFKMGAFKLAASTGTTILPIALKGTRSILRSESCLLQPGRIDVTFLPTLTPEGESWQDMVHLKNETRRLISQHCGEDLLDVVVAGPE